MSRKTPSDSPRTVKSVETTCEILYAIVELNGATLTELANHLDRSKASVYNHLTTLEQQELVAKNDNKFGLSLRFLELGEHVKDSLKVYDIAKAEIENLAEKTGARVQYVQEEYGMVVTVNIARAEHSIRPHSTVGTHTHMHCSASGKVHLAATSNERVEEILDEHGMPKMTPNTITSREELFEELTEIRDQGVAFNDEENLLGLRAASVPVRCPDGRLCGAVSLSESVGEMQNNKFYDKIPNVLTSTANRIEVSMQVQ